MTIKGLLSVHNKPWLIDPDSAISLLELFEQVKAGSIDYSKIRSEEASDFKIKAKFFDSDKVRMAPISTESMRSFEGFEGCTIACVPVSGPLMKADECGDLGMNSLMTLTRMAADTASVKTIMFLFDSPGGTADGTERFGNLIKACGKDTMAIVDGQCCSAAYWIASSCDKIYASSNTDTIGSIGVMCSIKDNTEALKKNGVVMRTYYATASKDKNRAFDEAKEGDGKLLIKEYLDPLSDNFMATVKSNRKLTGADDEDVLTGKTYFPKEAIKYGLIDGMKTYEDLVTETLAKAGTKLNFSFTNTTTMTVDQLKKEHPDVYAQAMADGVKAEADRRKGWEQWADVDAEAVRTGIASGAPITNNDISAFSATALKKSLADKAVSENAPAVKTADAGSAKLTDAQIAKMRTVNEARKMEGRPTLTEAQFIEKFL